ncbi:MAG: M23 family metallopeptidase [Acidobacteria bacterium]|nr:M23 family metallopeptidase [Acidobacteriota bacterium]
MTRLTCLAGALLLLGGAASAVAEDPALEVSHRARALHPGEVVVLEVRVAERGTAPRVTALGRSIRLFPVEDGRLWRGLVGIDLTAEPGVVPVAVEVDAGGTEVRETYELAVEPKQFPTRRLRVAPRYVDPPPDVLARIQREAQEVAAIFEVSSAERLWSGGFRKPVPGPATSSFGRRSVFNGQPRNPHSGTDFRSGAGTPVRAPNGGRVVLTGNQYFSGNVVILDHGWGLYSYFAHLSTIDVAEGDLVARGEVVGAVGATGRVTGAHLHWTLRLNEARVDPLALLELFPDSRSHE